MTNIFLLLSTYNGEKFLEEQLSSLKKQSIPFQLLVRDDGSSDRTLEILNQWKKEIPLKILAGQNVGVIESFNVLLNSLRRKLIIFFFVIKTISGKRIRLKSRWNQFCDKRICLERKFLFFFIRIFL
jgi:glycosyltransferase involved in cell wall biosynthesis